LNPSLHPKSAALDVNAADGMNRVLLSLPFHVNSGMISKMICITAIPSSQISALSTGSALVRSRVTYTMHISGLSVMHYAIRKI
jgi:hypothetical protein